jgi:hypothetical protein
MKPKSKKQAGTVNPKSNGKLPGDAPFETKADKDAVPFRFVNTIARSVDVEVGATSSSPAPEAKQARQPAVESFLECPPPEHLLEEAMKEPNRRLLQDYIQTIRVLRDEKGFTFREVADWLTKSGVDADHNAVYRVYTKGMTEAEVEEIGRSEAEEDDGPSL